LCVDLCEGVVCPGGGMCIDGACTDPVNMPTTSGSGGSGVSIGTDSTLLPGDSSSATTGVGGTSGNGRGLADGREGSDSGGCSCRVVSNRSPVFPTLLLLLGGVGAVLARRRTGS
jgi:MYXO-CTERM domain-containing protein